METAGGVWSLAILRGSCEMSYRIGDSLNASSEVLLTEISALLKENKLSIKDLDAMAVSTGPGSLTGIRIGLATAQGLAAGSKVACCGVPLFEALALNARKAPEPEQILTVVSAGKNQVYWQSFCVPSDSSKNDKSVPHLDNLDDFSAMLAGQATQKKQNSPKIRIITSRAMKEKLVFDFGSAESAVEVKYASDNVAKYIGLRYLELTAAHGFLGDARNILTPIYVREVRIGAGSL